MSAATRTRTLRPAAPVRIENTAMPVAGLFQMMIGAYYTQTIYVCAKLGLADELADGARSAAELAEATGTHAPTLERVMRAASMMGLLEEGDDGSFALTTLGTLLRSDAPGSVRGFAVYQGDALHWEATGRLLDGVREGRSPFEVAHGRGLYEHLDGDPEADAIFADAMTGFQTQSRLVATAAYDFSDVEQLVDVGGNEGAVLTAILAANPGMSGIVFDRPQVVAAKTARRIEEAGLGDRCRAIGGDFFEAVPDGGDAYMLSNILCDHPDEAVAKLLGNVRAAIRPDGRLLLLEMVLPAPNTPSFVTLGDIETLVTTPGRLRKEHELDALLRDAGFELTRIVPSLSPLSIVEARPVQRL
jgi:SAM-dependent methyltransferase